MAENQPPKSRREQFGERLKAKYPDREYADDEAMFGQADDDYASYEEQLGQYRDREKSLSDLLSKDPRSAQFITDMAKGTDPWIAVVERLGIDGWTELINDPSKQEELAEANKKYVERLAKEKSLEEEYNANFGESLKVLEQIQQEQGLSDETIDAAMDILIGEANDAIVGKFSREAIERALKSLNRDADIENARIEGEVAGRNAKIEENLRKPKGGDGMPNLAGNNNAATRQNGRRNFFDLVDAAR